jgi:hypothetical protein
VGEERSSIVGVFEENNGGAVGHIVVDQGLYVNGQRGFVP